MAIERPAVVQDGHIRLIVHPNIAMPQIAMDKGGLELPASRLHWAEKARNDLFHNLLAELLQFVMRSLDPNSRSMVATMSRVKYSSQVSHQSF